MMQCPACSAPLVSGEARCVACQALVNPPTNGNSALVPRLVTPQSVGALGNRSTRDASTRDSAGSDPGPSGPAKSADDAWRREVLERVRKRRQVRTRSLPLFVDPQGADREVGRSVPAPVPPSSPDVTFGEQVVGAPDDRDPLDPVDVLMTSSNDDVVFDLPLRPVETDNSEPSFSTPGSSSRGPQVPSQSLVVRSRPASVGSPVGTRSLVADLPLVEPTRIEPAVAGLPSRVAPLSRSFGAATMNDRIQAGFIDLGLWSAMSVTAFYFASRIARTSIVGMGSAWQGLTLFGLVLAAAYILFFGGLSGATPGKIACGIHVRRYDGSPLGPLASLGRGFLGILGVAFFGIGILPAFWDKDRRALHDRATDSRVTTA